MPKIDVYPVGWLKAILGVWRAYTRHLPADARRPIRRHALRALRGQLSNTVRHARNRRWRELKNEFNGYLAEPTPLPAGLRRCGSGWTKRRAVRRLDRMMSP